MIHKNKIQESENCNSAEHKQWNRRSFLQALGLIGGSTFTFANTPLLASKPSALIDAISQVENDRILIIIELQGGNDGLNTIVPVYDYDFYAKARPNLRINDSELISLNEGDNDFKIPKYVPKFKEMWGDGQMKVVHGVGYENSSLSHFTGADNLSTADPGNNQQNTGWMGRHFEDVFPNYLLDPPLKPAAIQIGNVSSITFKGLESDYGFTVSNPEKLFQIAKNGTLYAVDDLPPCLHGEQMKYLRSIANSTFNYAKVINEAYTSSSDYGGYSTNSLGKQLSIVSRMIKGNLGTKVYLVQLNGFDTHIKQADTHEALMRELSENLSNFYKDLKEAGWDDKVLSMTTSEFGRRVHENGSQGTDHGAASQSMFFGSGLNGSGFVGEHPDLSDLDEFGNLKFNTDFRELYATVLKDWLCVDPTLVNKILLGKEYEGVDLGFNCDSGPTLGRDDVFKHTNPDNNLIHYVRYVDNRPYLYLKMVNAGHVDIKLFDFLGKAIGTIKNEILFEKEYNININEAINHELSPGRYIYRIVTGNRSYSKSIMID